jgi:hypothetical protein
MRRRWLLSALLLLVTAATASYSAAAPWVSTGSAQVVGGGAVLGTRAAVLTFAGSIGNSSPTVGDPDPSVCAVFCSRWTLRVGTTAPVLVSIRTRNGSVDDGFNLYAYDAAGTLAGSSSGIGANGQALLIEHPRPQSYLLVVTTTYAYDADAAYVGEARLLPDPTRCRTRACLLLPRLEVVPPHDFHLSGVPPVPSTPLGFPFPVDAGTQSSCYAEESADTGAMRCLRFTNEIRNVGAGPLELRFAWMTADGASTQAGLVPGECRMQQAVHHGDGSVSYRAAGPCVFHSQHGHFHYQDMASLVLRRVNADGSSGAVVRRIAKQGFCLADDEEFWFGTARNRPRGFVGQPGCSAPGEFRAATPAPGAWVHMGISPGWGDVYTWDTPQQYVDVTSLPDGLYDVVSVANPDGALQVAGERRPSARTRICLRGDTAKMVAAAARHC